MEILQDYAKIKEASVKYNDILPSFAPVRRLFLCETTLTDIITEWLHGMQYEWVSDEIFLARIISRASVITLRLTITDSKLIMVYFDQTKVDSSKTTYNLVTTSSVTLLVRVLQLAQIKNYFKMIHSNCT